MPQIYSYEEAMIASTQYFKGNELAAKVFLDKYALRDNDDNLVEATPDQMHRRIAKEFARIEKKKFKTPLTEEYIYSLLENFGKIIPQGSPMYGIGNQHQIISLSNCFVIPSPEDSYAGICKADEELAQIAKRRGGDGVDIATLRPSGSVTHNAARTSTGTIPIMGRYSNTIREVGQNGRRGALMISTSIHHPESVIPWDSAKDGEEFMTTIKDKDYGEFEISSKFYNPKRIDFATCKYDKTKVTGANISIRLSDEFLNAAVAGKKFEQRWPIDSKNPTVSKMIDARACWEKIIYSAWRTAEPGVLFWDNIIRESPADCYAAQGFRTISTNPCGEIPLSAYDSCRLLVLNLFAFVKNPFTKDAYFDFEEFYKIAKVAQRLMDDLVDLEEECILKVIAKVESDPEAADVKVRELNLWQNVLIACRNGRRTGTGITALGDTIAALNKEYGGFEGINMTEQIYKTLKFAAYESSIDMAEEIGAFPVWNHEQEKDNAFLNRIKEEFCDLGRSNLSIEAARKFISGAALWERMKKVGRRNIALLTTAPTGSVSLLTKLVNTFGSSSGIEPQFDITPYTRKKKGNPGDKNFRSDSVDQNGDHWMHFEVYCSSLQDWKDITGETDYKKSPWWGNCANNLDWKKRVELQAAAQKHVDHSISSTVNLPSDVTYEKVMEIYEAAWKSGCKGITVYRDGCRSGVLVRKTETKKELTEADIDLYGEFLKATIGKGVPRTNAPKRPQNLPCDVHHIKVKGEDYFILVGLLGGDPYEVFAGKNGFIPKAAKVGTLMKMKRGHYKLILDDGTEISSVAEHINDEEEAITRMASMSLRHGVDIAYLVHQLEKVNSKEDMSAFYKALCRALKKYIKEGVKISGDECPECKGILVRESGCAICKSCGWSACK